MKCFFTINMYSGAQPPERELKPEEIEKVNELVSKLNVKWEGAHPFFGLSALGTDSYSVYWLDERWFGDGIYPITNAPIITDFPGPWMWVRTQPGGPVQIYRKPTDSQPEYLKDTVGLWEYLSTIGCPLLARHIRDLEEGMSEYYEKVLGIPYEKKV